MPLEKHDVFYVMQAADQIVKIQELTGRELTREPEVCGKDKNGYVVRWHFSDVVLELRRVNSWYEVVLMLEVFEAEYTPAKGLIEDE
jgi:hypothetical protein